MKPQQGREVIPRWRSLIGYLLLPPSEVDHGVRSVKDECLSKVILFGDRSPRRAVNCSLIPRRCAAQDRCDAASGWVDFCALLRRASAIEPYALMNTSSYFRLCHSLSMKVLSRNRP